MNIVAVGCIHNDLETLLAFIDKLSALTFDIVVCPGDFTDNFLPRGFSRGDVGALIIEELRSLGKPVFVVPGSWDKELMLFFEQEGISVHGVGKAHGNLGLYGFGGAKTPFSLPFEPSEDEIHKGLVSGYKMVESSETKVQVTHAPPFNTKLDLIPSGAHVGSEAIRKFIEKNQPEVAICSHIHEARGHDVIGNTQIINCGRFPEGYCGLITIDKHKVTTKIVNLI
ncbi:MAG: metallophosphoesterase [Candidatus Aenigmarchaeota archaeon]|nr:metallophosphoesterase [Candidatus Aenigmarchaeota archaeon]